MPGRNVYVPRVRRGALNEHVPQATTKTVFISHRSADKPFARALAAEIVLWGVNVWLDEDDEDTQAAAEANDDKALALAIEAGVRGSTHMLALMSPRTKGSAWVPYEVGAGRAQGLPLAFVVERWTRDLPAWVALGDDIHSVVGLRFWLRDVIGPLANVLRLRHTGDMEAAGLTKFLM